MNFWRNTLSAKVSRRSWTFLVLASCLGGCGLEGNPETVPVQGIATYNGKPLPAGKVKFNPVDPTNGRPAEGPINADGSFILSTHKDNDGAWPGEYNVSVISFEVGSGGLDKDKGLGLGIGDRSAIPTKYNDPKTSGLNVTVESGKPLSDVKLDLKKE